MSGPDMRTRLEAYLEQRDRERAAGVARVMAGLEPREAQLVREVAVMGYVQGLQAGGGRPPKDSVVLAGVLEACAAMSDLYPTVAAMAEHVPVRHPREIEAARLVAEHAPTCPDCGAGATTCGCGSGSSPVCQVCADGAVLAAQRTPATWPCPTLSGLGRWAWCDNEIDDRDGGFTICGGVLVFRPQDLQARCLTCGAFCGAQGARYVTA